MQSVPVARKPGQKAAYHLVFGTRSEHGLWFFGDAVARARDAWWEGLEIKEEREDPDTLFSAISVVRPDPQEATDAAVPAMADNMERILYQQKRPFKLLNHTLDVFGDCWVNATETVSTMSSVSVPRLATGGSSFPVQATGVAVIRRHGLASRFALVGGR